MAPHTCVETLVNCKFATAPVFPKSLERQPQFVCLSSKGEYETINENF